MSSKAQRRGSDYRRKRKRFHNNQYTRKVSDKLDVDCISASAKKLCKESDLDKEVRNSNQSNGYRLINIDILLSELSQYVTCPNCNTKAVLKEKILYGLVSEFYVECYSCSTLSTFKSSPVIASGKDYEVNTRITYAMRTVGQGFCGIKHFCTAMDLPPPVSQKAYEKILRKINLASCEVADDSMKNAAKEEILASGSNEICVSGDGDTSNLEIHLDECSKALGLTWNSGKDTFTFNLKIFYQLLWLLKLDWDSPLPFCCKYIWKTSQKEVQQVCSIHIPWWIHTASQKVTLHGFCDASELAYATIIYSVQPQSYGNTKATLLVAKSRVAPVKPVSIPRLELNGVLLLARLYATCKNIFKEYEMFTSMQGLTHKWFYIGRLLIQGNGSITLPMTRFQRTVGVTCPPRGIQLTLHAEVYHLKNFLHASDGGKALSGFPVECTLGRNNPKVMITLV
ncbi:uncharacterized protein TNCT_303901 [Trichonephila clavata]|uniref:Mutator-like transposase domain-containing protein n=1 Tax=Trichonephila clavata TaxID=2740835 RepID=A0A8X6I1R0_TRICU|nr:uncharacterized protein TNCT_303901 [Trichonephila clavata]